MPGAVPPSPLPDRTDGLGPQIASLVEAAHGVWASPGERRRLRMFGFVPARQEGVLKRDWHGWRVRVSTDELRVIAPEERELVYRADSRQLLFAGEPFDASPPGMAAAEQLIGLIQAYERWVEVREGKDERLRRGHATADHHRMNALAETRRLQRALQQARPRARGRGRQK